MVKKLVWVLLFVWLAGPVLAETVVKPGDSTPLIKLPNVNGEITTLDLAAGNKTTLLCFFASWSKPCQEEVALLQSLYAEKKVNVVGISFDRKVKDLQTYLAENKVDFTVLSDSKLKTIKDFGIIIIPTLLAIDPQGKVTNIYVDFDANTKSLIASDLHL